ncbi:MAG: GGDEF domain-containing protein [Candidatus Pacebacteria bacterium]|nr:GGDEF domain-containing protein [Candidatus Paceibacterota bacterium]
MENFEKKEETIEDLKEQLKDKEAEIERLKQDLMHDNLTGLKTRKFFLETVQADVKSLFDPEKEKRKESLKNLSIIFCDIDNFKKLNDKHGHSYGDKILKEVSNILQKNVRGSDIVCRYGGEEFVIALRGSNEEETQKIAEKLKQLIEQSTEVTISAGVSQITPLLLLEETIESADQAMLWAKESGKNQIKTFSQYLKESKDS